ncbi:unnamed protein product [Victoria cruziana]
MIAKMKLVSSSLQSIHNQSIGSLIRRKNFLRSSFCRIRETSFLLLFHRMMDDEHISKVVYVESEDGLSST